MTVTNVRERHPAKWVIVCLLSLGMVIAYVDRTNLSVVLALPSFRNHFQLSDIDRGLLNSAFFWSYALLQIPAGWLVDRYGAKLPYSIGFIFWSLISAATGLVQSVGQLVSMRLLLGVGESVSTSASVRWIRFNCTEQERGLATGILFAGTKVGAAIGVPLAAFLVSRFDWQRMFIITGLGALLWFIAWQVLVRKDRPQAPAVVHPGAPTSSQDFLAFLKTGTMWGIVLGTFAYNYFVYYCLTWLPSYLVESRHLSLNSMSLYTMFSFGGMAIVSILAGWGADRLIGRGAEAVSVRKAFTILGFLFAATEVFGAVSHSQNVSLFFALFSLSGLGLATANYWALTQTIVPAGAMGRAIGVQNFASNCSGIVAPIVTGWLKEVTGSYLAPMIAVLVILLLGVFSYGLLVKPVGTAAVRHADAAV
jgi:ACS family D-galactonate transporter-like MFS transporter